MPRLKYPRSFFVLLTSMRIHTKLCFVYAVSGIKISVIGKQAITSSQNFLLFISFLSLLRSCLPCSPFLSFFLHSSFIFYSQFLVSSYIPTPVSFLTLCFFHYLLLCFLLFLLYYYLPVYSFPCFTLFLS